MIIILVREDGVPRGEMEPAVQSVLLTLVFLKLLNARRLLHPTL
jgi:hypothetical protein